MATNSSDLHIISLGAGVQSTTMLLMALAGELEPMPAAAIFADTGWEPATVYRHLDWCEAQMATAGMPLYRVRKGNLRQDVLDYVSGQKSSGGWRLPFHSADRAGRPTMLQRQCTRDYKIIPIQRQLLTLLKAAGAARVVQWIGISLDEATRMKLSGARRIENRWPLIERRMSRSDCVTWLAAHGYDRPAKSACIGCPYHSAREWRSIKDDQAAWADAVEFDDAVRQLRGRGAVYLHQSRRPLREVDLSTEQERGQLELWDAECDGMCGV